MTDYKEKYFKYKNKYSSIKNQLGGSARGDSGLSQVFSGLYPNQQTLPDYLGITKEIKLAMTSKENMTAFRRLRNSYTSTYAPDITIIPINSICPGPDNLNCNRYITHSRIKMILHKNSSFISIPADGSPVIPSLQQCLLRTIITNNEIDGEFLVSIGVTIQIITLDQFRNQGLTAIYIPSSVTTIDKGAFFDNQLTRVTIPEGVITIGHGAFARNQLNEVVLPQSLTTIGVEAFQFNQLTRVVIPEGITIIKDGTFTANLLTEVILPESVTTIENFAFSQNQLTKVDLPKNLRTIKYGAFGRNQLIEVILPESLIKIDPTAFNNNRTIQNVTIPTRFKNQLTDLFDLKSSPNIKFAFI
jgi:hypothetical protein